MTSFLTRELARAFVRIIGDVWTFDRDVKARSVEVATAAFIKGSKFALTFPISAAGGLANVLFVAPVACKIVGDQRESHVTVCDAADVLNLEKLESGEALGAGDLLLSTGFTLNSTANTPVAKAAVTTAAATFAVGDRLALRMTTGDGTDYANGTLTLVFQVL